MILNEDYRDMLHALSAEKVRFLLVGAYAMAAHGYPRATMDIDVWVMPSADNIEADIDEIKVRIPCLTDLLRNKRASGRMKDLADAEALEALQESQQRPERDK